MLVVFLIFLGIIAQIVEIKILAWIYFRERAQKLTKSNFTPKSIHL